jgi:hypothetical protein
MRDDFVRGETGLIFAEWVFRYRNGSLREWKIWDSQAANAREIFGQSWSILSLETACSGLLCRL